MDALVIDPAFRGRGLGKSLAKVAVAIAVDLGATEITALLLRAN